MKPLILDRFDYDQVLEQASGKLDADKKVLHVVVPAIELKIDVSSLETEKIKEWCENESNFRLSQETTVTVGDARMLKKLLAEKDKRSAIRAWDYETHIRVFSDSYHCGLTETQEEFARVREAADEIAKILRKLTGKEHSVEDHGYSGVYVSYDDMFTDAEEAEKWFGWAHDKPELEGLMIKHNLIWES